MTNSLESNLNRLEFCTPIIVEVGFTLDPVGALQSAKQLACSAKRNVEVHIEVRGTDVPMWEVVYYIQPASNYAYGEIVDARVKTLVSN